MASTDSRIRSINIVFTPSSTIIQERTSSMSTTYLLIQVTPNHNGKDIGSIKICYSDPNSSPSRFNEEINNSDMLTSIAYTMNDTLNQNTLVDQVASYLKTLPNEEISVIMKEYSKYIEDGILLDGFIAGIASYLTFLLLNENSIFMNQISFQMTIPFMVNNSSCITRNMFKYLTLPLSGLSKVSRGVLFQLVTFLQSFINIWEPAFVPGPIIDNNNEAKICMEVISGLANDATEKLSKIQTHQNTMMSSLNAIETRLKLTIDDSLNKMKREINDLLIETRASIKDLTDHVIKQLNVVDCKIEDAVSTIDDVVKHKVGKIVENQLDSQIKHKISSEIENTQERIGEIITHYTMNEGKKIVTEAVDKRESSLQGKLIGLEHRIEILYNNMSASSGEKLIINENKDVSDETFGDINSGARYHGEIPTTNTEIPGIIHTYEEHPNTQVISNGSQTPIRTPGSIRSFIANQRPSINNEENSITPISGDRTSSKKFIQPPSHNPNRSTTSGLERPVTRETFDINSGRRVTIIGDGESNPTSISDDGGQPGTNYIKSWRGYRVPKM